LFSTTEGNLKAKLDVRCAVSHVQERNTEFGGSTAFMQAVSNPTLVPEGKAVSFLKVAL